jgi:hypothetical protein
MLAKYSLKQTNKKVSFTQKSEESLKSLETWYTLKGDTMREGERKRNEPHTICRGKQCPKSVRGLFLRLHYLYPMNESPMNEECLSHNSVRPVHGLKSWAGKSLVMGFPFSFSPFPVVNWSGLWLMGPFNETQAMGLICCLRDKRLTVVNHYPTTLSPYFPSLPPLLALEADTRSPSPRAIPSHAPHPMYHVPCTMSPIWAPREREALCCVLAPGDDGYEWMNEWMNANHCCSRFMTLHYSWVYS